MSSRNVETYNAYQRAYQLKRYHARRNEAIRSLGGKCVFCDSTEDLQIDHIEKHEKNIKLSNLWSISYARYLKELEKCQVLCESCHRGKTSLDNSVGHGGGMTGMKNCRCSLCAPLKNDYMREFKANRK